jgi:predicted DNA-binding protein
MKKQKFKPIKLRLTEEQYDNLKLLSSYLTRPVAVLIREAIDGHLYRNEAILCQGMINNRLRHIDNIFGGKFLHVREEKVEAALNRLKEEWEKEL